MKRFVLTAICLAASTPSVFASTDAHVHTPWCNHQFSDFQGAVSFSAPRISLESGTMTRGGGMTFILNDLGGVGAGTAARAGFEAAAALWSSVLMDPITITLDVRFAALNPGILGSTGSTTNNIGYTALRSLLAADATSATDASAVAALQPGPLSFVSNEPGVGLPISATQRVLDNNNTVDNNNIRINTAQVKALGLMPTYDAGTNPGGRDGSVSFSTAFNWDFDRSDGLTPGFFDFVGVAAHEIGHALGFVSGVDIADNNVGASGLNAFVWGSVMDLQRYGSFQGVQTLDWSIGGAPCMSINAGASCVGPMSTGRTNGDGRQASHWKDDSLLGLPAAIGIMDPTVASASSNQPTLIITAADLTAFDAMGYNLTPVPEPESLALMLAGLGAVGAMVRRRRQTASV